MNQVEPVGAIFRNSENGIKYESSLWKHVSSYVIREPRTFRGNGRSERMIDLPKFGLTNPEKTRTTSILRWDVAPCAIKCFF